LKSADQNFATIAKEENVEWPDKVRRLSLLNTLQNLQQNKTTSHLRSLLMFGVMDLPTNISLSKLFPAGFRRLNVFDLQGAPIESFPGKVAKLFHLKYLSFRDTKVKTIPRSIKKLINLETLDLKGTYVNELPVEILELKKLRHLLVYRQEITSYADFNSKHGFKAPAGIGGFPSLQKLCFVEADQGSSSTLMAELGKMTKLRRLGIIKLRREDGVALCSSLEKLSNLRALSITSLEEDEIIGKGIVF
jgi:disease resistance protein RPM1